MKPKASQTLARPKIHEYDKYREYLKDLSDYWRGRGGRQADLAAAMKCQPAYFSQVLRENVHLTEDQALLLSAHQGLSSTETDYLLTLLRLEKAGTPALREYLGKAKDELLTKLTNVDERIASKKVKEDPDLVPYYSSDWLVGAIHVATSCKPYQTTEAIAKRLMITEEVAVKHLEKLAQYGLVELRNGKWLYREGSVHFSKESVHDMLFQISRRLMAMDSLKKRAPEDVRYAVIYASDKATQQKVRALFLDFIEQLHKEIGPSPSQEVYSIVLDSFKV